jgi:hypothetical protein
MVKRNKSNKPLIVGDWVFVRVTGMGRDNYQIESIEDGTYTCVFTEGTYKHRLMVSKSKLERI